MTKRKTTREVLAENQKAIVATAVNDAMGDLIILTRARDTLRAKHKQILREAIRALTDEIEWLIAESDDHKSAAAQLFIGKSPRDDDSDLAVANN